VFTGGRSESKIEREREREEREEKRREREKHVLFRWHLPSTLESRRRETGDEFERENEEDEPERGKILCATSSSLSNTHTRALLPPITASLSSHPTRSPPLASHASSSLSITATRSQLTSITLPATLNPPHTLSLARLRSPAGTDW
jgi:hypothetical protein